MIVILKSEIFASQEINQLKLLSLIQLGEKRHLIQIKPRNSHEERKWLDKQAQDVRDACEHVFKLGYRLDSDEYGQFSPFTIQIGLVKKSQWFQKEPLLPLEAALEFLSQSFTVFVENRRNDPAFLKATATGWRKDKLTRLAKNNWLKFEGGGGIGEVFKYAEEILGQPDKYLRSFLLFDSDALKPNEPSKQSQEVVAICHLIIPYHQLKRRAIENYLPYETLSIWMGMDVHKSVAWVMGNG